MEGGRRASVEDNLRWNTTFIGRRPFVGRQPLVKDDLWWRTPFGGRQPLVEDDLWWKMTFSGRQPLLEDDLCGKTTFSGRLQAVEDDLQRKTPFVRSLHVAISALQHFKCRDSSQVQTLLKDNHNYYKVCNKKYTILTQSRGITQYCLDRAKWHDLCIMYLILQPQALD